MKIFTNTSAVYAHQQLGSHQALAKRSQEKLATGLRINRASDDAAGLAISEKMRSQIRGLDQASRNTQDGLSLIQTAEGALNETHQILQRMRELAVQAANDTYTISDRQGIQQEVDSLSEEINRIANSTTFNNHSLLTGQKEFSFQVGANAGQTISLHLSGISTKQLGLTAVESTNVIGIAGEIQTNKVTQIGRATTPSDPGHEIVGYYDAEGKNGAGYYIGDELKYAASLPEKNGTYQVYWEGKSYQITLSDETVTTVTPTLDVIDSTGNVLQASWFEATEEREAGYYKENTLFFTSSKPLAVGQSIIIDENNEMSKTLSVLSKETANDAITKLDQAIVYVSGQRSLLGATQNRLEHTLTNLHQSSENLQAAESRIRDTDVAKEIINVTKQNLLANVAQSMLAQANQQPLQVLALLE
ncbi:flagellin [Shouchella sp. 1P09AA]|uniref:flagellin N-terminal helical domain-containing protein n=1 Tax=unclassified Shouchella TaxID=2893065 RepID=UPI0039A3C03D